MVSARCQSLSFSPTPFPAQAIILVATHGQPIRLVATPTKPCPTRSQEEKSFGGIHKFPGKPEEIRIVDEMLLTCHPHGVWYLSKLIPTFDLPCPS